MLTDDELAQRLSSLLYPRITKEYIESRIARTFYENYTDSTLTLCHIILDNGYEVIGKAACVYPENYQVQIGQKLAYDDAFRQLWPLFGFMLAETRRGNSACSTN